MFNPNLSGATGPDSPLPIVHERIPSHVNAIAVVAYDDTRQEIVVVRANRAFLQLADVPSADYVGFPLASLFAPDQRHQLSQEILNCLMGDEVIAGTALVQRRNGKSTQMLFEASILVQSGTSPVECLVVLRTLVEQIAVPTKLDDMAAIPPPRSQTTRVGSWTVAHGPERAIRCSPEMLEIFGVSSEELEGNPFAPMSRCHPADRERIEGAMHFAISARRNVEFEHRILLPSGEVRWIYARVTVPADPAVPYLALGLVFDITDRVRAEAAFTVAERRFLEAAEASPDCLMILKSRRNAQGAIVDFQFENLNQRALDMLLRGRDAVVGTGLCEVFPQIRAVGHLCHLVDVVETGIPYQQTVCNESQELKARWTHLQAVRLGDGLVISYRDISQEKRLEEELSQSHRLESVGRLAASIAHDFNNMLSVILSLDSMVHDALPADSQERQDLAESLKATARAGELTRRLLAFSRQQVLDPAAVAPNALLAEITTIIKVLAGNKTRVVMNLAKELNEIWIDAAQLEQAIVNLVTNARDAMPDGGTLRIETMAITLSGEGLLDFDGIAPGDYCQIRVSDTGVGIAHDIQTRIFEPFFTTKGEQQGTGLGLASVFGFVKQSGGHIAIDSNVCQGTTVRILLPCVRDRQRSHPPSSPVVSDSRSPCSETILLLEHDDAVARAMQRILQARGYSVFTAKLAADAVKLAQAHGTAIDLLVTDTMPPVPDGSTLLVEFLQNNPNVGLLCTAGPASGQDAETSHLDLGAIGLAKPVTPERLLAKVREAMAMARLVAKSRAQAIDSIATRLSDACPPDSRVRGTQ